MAHVVAMILAAGQGARFGGDSQKQLAGLAGRPLLVWSVLRFASHPAVAETVIVVPPGREQAVGELLAGEGFEDAGKIVGGGQTRQESSWLGLQAVPAGATHVLVHDAARPCLSGELVTRVTDALKENNAVIPAVPVVDTLVRERSNAVDAVLDRVFVSGVQTPQGFEKDLLLRAHRRARANGFSSNDEGSLVLALGEKVATVRGDRTNIKITYPEDAAIAEAILGGAG